MATIFRDKLELSTKECWLLFSFHLMHISALIHLAFSWIFLWGKNGFGLWTFWVRNVLQEWIKFVNHGSIEYPCVLILPEALYSMKSFLLTATKYEPYERSFNFRDTWFWVQTYWMTAWTSVTCLYANMPRLNKALWI